MTDPTFTKHEVPLAVPDLAALRSKKEKIGETKLPPWGCHNCTYWHEESELGLCRRYPPSAFPAGTGTVVSVSPFTRPEFQCGEWAEGGI